MKMRNGGRTSERGFALVVAILALLLLTFLGLTLAATTSTELQIASNQRWNEQAYYNAEAGLELGRRVLMNANWAAVMWAPRIAAPMASPAPPPVPRNDSWNVPVRTFENAECDTDGVGAGYGWVLDDGSAAAPYQNVVAWRDAGGQPYALNGSFTLWIRPRMMQDPDSGTMIEDEDAVILTAEGTAPYVVGFNAGIDAAAARHVTANRAVQVLEMTVSRLAVARCAKDEAQAGGDAAGSGMKACDPTPTQLRVPGATAGPAGALGTGNEINAGVR